MTNWTWASATRIGSSHIRDASRVQDAHWVGQVICGGKPFFTCVVSDGAGSASHGGQGASVICREVSKKIKQRAFLASPNEFIPDDDVIQRWVDEVRDKIYLHAGARGITAKNFAATMILVISDGTHTKISHIGDGAAVLRARNSGQWSVPMWPDHGEYASTTYFLTDDPSPRLRLDSLNEPINGICVFSDGLERLALDFSKREPHKPFFDMMFTPLQRSQAVHKNRMLSDSLGGFLMSETVTNRTDDDKTIVLAFCS